MREASQDFRLNLLRRQALRGKTHALSEGGDLHCRYATTRNAISHLNHSELFGDGRDASNSIPHRTAFLTLRISRLE